MFCRAQSQCRPPTELPRAVDPGQPRRARLNALSLTCIIVGLTAHVIGYLWLVILAYREAQSAGRAAMFVWPIGFLIVFIRWDADVAKPFFLALAGILLYWAGTALEPAPPPQPPPANPTPYTLPQ